MRRQVGTYLGIALTTSLTVTSIAFTTSAAAAAAGATGTTTAAATKARATADDPYSVFKISKVKYTKKVKPGGWLKYSFTATNTGPFEADYYWIGATLPKGIDPKGTLYWVGPKGTTCSWKDREFWCWTPHILKAGSSDTLSFWLRLSKKAKGTQVAKLGAINYDVPHGAEDLNKDRLKDLGIKGWIYSRTVKTSVIKPTVRPTVKPTRRYDPPPPPPVLPRRHHTITNAKPT
jgi:hypothetical protein